MMTLLTLILYLHVIHLSYSQWISPSSPNLMVGVSHPAVGYYQNTIYIIGGQNNENGLMEFNLNNTAISNNPSFFSKSLHGYSQWWYQINSILYIITDGTVDTLNLETKQFTDGAFTIPTAIGDWTSCLAGDDTQSLLYYLGGKDGGTFLDNLQILNISDGKWTTGPNMNTVREYFTCIVSPNKQLYAIGGGNETNYLSSIEVISTTNIVNNQWVYIQSLSDAADRLKSVLLDNDIFIIGGWIGGGQATDTVHVINTLTNEVYFPADSIETLVYPICCTAPIVVDRTIYALGGNIPGAGATNKWQYISLPLSTKAPTVVPTEQPSHTPSNNPTKYPSQQPSISPSIVPSYPPSTLIPTISPSNVPTTVQPSAFPTGTPSVSPSTREPSLNPSTSPTAAIDMSTSQTQSVTSTAAPSIHPTAPDTLSPSEMPTPSLVSTEGTYNTTAETTEPPDDSNASNSRHPTARPTTPPSTISDVGGVVQEGLSTTNTPKSTRLHNGEFDVVQLQSVHAILIIACIACFCFALGLVLLVTLRKRINKKKQLHLMHAKQATSLGIGEMAKSSDKPPPNESQKKVPSESQDPIKKFLTSISPQIVTSCYDKFIANGWKTMESICIMENEDLKEMGILPGERKLILYHIKKYNYDHNVSMNQEPIQINNLRLLSINSNSSTLPMSMSRNNQPMLNNMPSLNNQLSIDVVYGGHYDQKENENRKDSNYHSKVTSGYASELSDEGTKEICSHPTHSSNRSYNGSALPISPGSTTGGGSDMLNRMGTIGSLGDV